MTIKTCYTDEYNNLCEIFHNKGIPFSAEQVDTEYHITTDIPYEVIFDIMKFEKYW